MRQDARFNRSYFIDALIAVGAVIAAAWVVDVVLALHWTPHVEVLNDGEVLTYPATTLWVIIGIGSALVIAGLRLGFDRQFYNWLFVGIGTGVAVLGTSFAWSERVVITADEFAVRRWWGLESRAWKYEDVDAITVVSHHRRRGNHWITVSIETGNVTESVRVPRLFSSAQLALQTAARAKGVRVTWTLDSRR